ncbi:MAG: cation:proton antiporter [Actinobacteria bacterium]|nr:cation:proton antiporter [Actinomycetota bacterium]
MNLVAPDEHQLLVFWTQFAVLLLVARTLGVAMKRIGQPAVVGELGAGLLLGPSVLGGLLPGVSDWLFPADDVQSAMLFAVSWIGAVFLLVSTGFETDLALIRRLGRGAALVATGSLVVPLAMGIGLGFALPPVFSEGAGTKLIFVLFMATALSISSLPVIAKILGEMGLMRRNFGQMTLAAGMANDVVGWILLGVIAGLAQAGEIAVGPLAITLLGMAAFILGALTVGQRAVDALLRQLRRRQAGPAATFTAVVVVALVAGAVTQFLGVEAVIGAFVAGIVLGRSKFKQAQVEEQLEVVTAGVVAPIFFATSGLRVDLGLLADPQVLFWGAVVIAVASVSKFSGAWVGARAARLPGREGLALGVGLNARGAVEIVIATIGLSLGVLNQASYTVVVLMAIATSMMAGPMLRAVARSWQGTDEEQRRLQREESVSRNVMVRSHRLLLPSQGGINSIVAAQVLHYAWLEDVEATVLSVGADAAEAGVRAVVDIFDDRPVSLVKVSSDHASEAILGEARLGYGAIGVGAPEASEGPWILSPIVDDLLTQTLIPVVIVRRARNLDRALPGAFARALVPVSATASSRAAQEIAFNLSASIGTEVLLTHVTTPAPAATEASRSRRADGAATSTVPRADVGATLIERAEAFADELGARARTVDRSGSSPADEIVRAAVDEEVDLVVLGANLRQLQGRPFLGHVVEQVLEQCDATVVVVASPSGPHG